MIVLVNCGHIKKQEGRTGKAFRLLLPPSTAKHFSSLNFIFVINDFWIDFELKLHGMTIASKAHLCVFYGHLNASA